MIRTEPQPPMAAPDELAVDIAEIPLPPEELIAEALAHEAPAAAKPAKAAAEVAALDFVAPARRVRTLPLEHPFRLDGRVVEAITLNRLSGAEIGAFVRDHVDARGAYDQFDLYAALTGLPAPVLRGLDGDDLTALTDAAQAFFPRSFGGTGASDRG